MIKQVDMKTVAERLKYAMKKEGINDYKLEEISGVKRSTIKNFLNTNNNPRLDTVANICVNLNLSVDWLIYGGTEDDMYIERENVDLLSDEFLQKQFASLSDMKKYLMIRLNGDEDMSNNILLNTVDLLGNGFDTGQGVDHLGVVMIAIAGD